jgi:hypothetical protein
LRYALDGGEWPLYTDAVTDANAVTFTGTLAHADAIAAADAHTDADLDAVADANAVTFTGTLAHADADRGSRLTQTRTDVDGGRRRRSFTQMQAVAEAHAG